MSLTVIYKSLMFKIFRNNTRNGVLMKGVAQGPSGDRWKKYNDVHLSIAM